MEFKNRFLKIVTKSGVSFAAISFGCLLPYMSLAASSNGCDDLDKNDSINPEIALCSTHVYNIKAVTNPDSNTAKSQLMKDVVALKSTIIMQQMYKQYEYLEATISRLKTQLRREILTSKLETAGASSSSSSSSTEAIYYNAQLDIDNSDGLLRIDMTAEVNITIDEKDNVLSVPLTAIRDDDFAGNAVLYLLDKQNQIVKQPIKTGIRDEQYIEVISGIGESDRIIIGDDVATAEAEAMSNMRGPRPRM